jgi:aconitate decarboxylase
LGLTRTFCEKLIALGGQGFPAPVLAAARRLFLDGLGVAVAGCREEAVLLLAEHYRGYEARGEATALGLGFRTAAPWAAALNGAAMHVLDFEPMWSPATHALSTTLPAVLALAEVRGASGRDILAALIKGVEAQSWLRHAGHASDLPGETFHPPGVVGPIGSAIAAGSLLGLPPDVLAAAVGIAASRAGSLFANAGTMTKCTHCGHAAQAGLEAALLAARGFTSHPDIIAARDGFADAFLGESFNADALLGVGASFRMVDPGFALKMFPCQFGTHFAVSAGLALSGRIGSAAQVRRIRLTAPVMPYVNRPFPETGLLGKFSFQYAFCRALLDGAVRIDTFTDDAVADPTIARLLERVELAMDPAIPATFEAMRVDAEVELADGTVLGASCDAPRGSWRGEPVSDEEHLGKVRDCLSQRLPAAVTERCVELATRIDALGPPEVAELMSLAGAFDLQDGRGGEVRDGDQPRRRRKAELDLAAPAGGGAAGE